MASSAKRPYDSDDDDDRTPESSDDEEYDEGFGAEEDTDDGSRMYDNYQTMADWREAAAKCVVKARDDIPITGIKECPPGAPYFVTKREGVPDPFNQDIPPHKNNTLDDRVYNIRRAIEEGDEDFTTVCLVDLFELFIRINARIVILLPESTPNRVALSLMPSIGPFNNLNALAMHQYIHNLVWTLYLELVGVSTPTAVLELDRLWILYETYLFCDPYHSLSHLMALGKLLCRSYKDGTIAYAVACWGDTAKDRMWRDEAYSNMPVLSMAIPETRDFIKSCEQLSKPNRYYVNRQRLTLYSKAYLEDFHYKYILQAKGMSPKLIVQLIDRHIQKIEDYINAVPGDTEASLASDIFSLIRELCIVNHNPVNYLHSPRKAQQLQCKLILFLHLLCDLMSDANVRAQGRYGIFSVSSRRVSELQPTLTSSCARDVRETLHGSRRVEHLKYGVIGDDLPIHTNKVKPAKSKKEPVPINMGEIAFPRGPVVQRTHQGLHPSVVCTLDSKFVFRDSIHLRVHTSVRTCMQWHMWLYLAKLNWSRIKRSAQQAGSKNISSKMRFIDQAIFDFDLYVTVFEREGYRAVQVPIRPTSIGFIEAYSVEEEKKAVRAKEVATALSSVELSLAEETNSNAEAVAVKDYFDPVEEIPTPLQAVVIGPFAPGDECRIQKRTADTLRAKQDLGIAPAMTLVIPLVLKAFPIHNLKYDETQIKVDRPSIFVVQVPYQRPGAIMTLHSVTEWTMKMGLTTIRRCLSDPERIMPVVAYAHVMRPKWVGRFLEFIYISLAMQVEHETVTVMDVRFSVLLDDLTSDEELTDVQVRTLRTIREKLATSSKNAKDVKRIFDTNCAKLMKA